MVIGHECFVSLKILFCEIPNQVVGRLFFFMDYFFLWIIFFMELERFSRFTTSIHLISKLSHNTWPLVIVRIIFCHNNKYIVYTHVLLVRLVMPYPALPWEHSACIVIAWVKIFSPAGKNLRRRSLVYHDFTNLIIIFLFVYFLFVCFFILAYQVCMAHKNR